jgi:hypothetical protein
LVEHSRDSAVPLLWDLIDAIDYFPRDPERAAANAEYLAALADGVAVGLGKRPEAVTPAGES